MVAPNPPLPDDPRLTIVTGEISDAAAVEALIDDDTDTVFHLAAVVSAQAEEDFDLGMRVNLDGTRITLERCRALDHTPRVVYASSAAAFGGDMPDVIDDLVTPNPQTTYGVTKVIGEYLIDDYSRKGFIDGRALRLPTIVVRPGRPNKAASTWASSILREPLAGTLPFARSLKKAKCGCFRRAGSSNPFAMRRFWTGKLGGRIASSTYRELRVR